MKRVQRYAVIIVSIIFFFLIILTFSSKVFALGDTFNQHIKKFTRIVDIIQRSYVDDVKMEELLVAAINGMLAHLDPHSEFLGGEDYQIWIKEFGCYTRTELKSIPYALLVQPEVAYIKINLFSINTEQELRSALAQLTCKGMKRLMLDLRGNKGGYLSAAVAVADQFLPGGTRIVSIQGRSSQSSRSYMATTKQNFRLYPMIVLIDNKTASSAEIVAGALQDWDRALIVGQTSFGKALVQSQYQLDDSSAVLITTSRFYIPSGRLIQRQCDYSKNDQSCQENYSANEMKRLPSYHTATGRLVYGGSGISPDVLLPTQFPLSDSSQQLIGAEQQFLYTSDEGNIKQYSQLREDSVAFLNYYVSIQQQFEQSLKKMNDEYLDFPFYNYRDKLKYFSEQELAYVCWGNEARCRGHLANDHQLQQALQLFDQAAQLLMMTQWGEH